jgi:serine protease Do
MKKIIITSLIFIFGISVGFGVFSFYYTQTNNAVADDLNLDDQEATIRAIKKVIPAVVSIIVYDQQEYYSVDLSTGEQTSQNKKVEEGRGTGFIISPDGFILTNKHVVNAGAEKTAEYRITLNSGKQYYAQLIGKDPLNDLAVLKIFDKDLPCIELGDSSDLQLGSTVMAIGNVLGRYQNSVTKGIVSGLGRELIASDNHGNTESFKNVIQTDAEINFGNSGGPLIDLEGKLIGINVAIDSAGSSVGFAIPINDARSVITSVIEKGRIIRTKLGVRYFMLTPQLALEYKLPTDTGAWLSRGDRLDLPAVLPDSPAAKAGIEEGDIISEVNAVKIEGTNTLTSVIQNYKPGDKIGLKIRRGDKIIIREVTLDEFKE